MVTDLMELLEIEDFGLLLFRFILNALFAYIVIDRIYYRINKQREYLFTFVIFNLLIFFVSSLLSSVKMKTGFAFGLFAIFSILRYRTEQINIKEMTFLFTCIILAVVNSTVTDQVPILQILFADIMITIAIYYLEKKWLKGFTPSLQITFEHIDLIHRNRRKELFENLEERTGFIIQDYEIIDIDYLRDTAKMKVYYE